MFLTRSVLDIVVSAKQQAFDVAVEALRAAHELSLAAKETEVDALKRRVEDLDARLRYERSRADALVDRLLVRDARVAAVAPAAVEAARLRDEQAVKKLSEIFDEANSAGEIPPAAAGPRAFDFAGRGSAVVAGV